MDISFTSDTYPHDRVADLTSELRTMVNEIAEQNHAFPFDIGIVIRCLPDGVGRKPFHRFRTKDNSLTIDITVSHDLYRTLSMNEQREQLGASFIDFFEKSLHRNKKRATIEDTTYMIRSVRRWMKANNWIEGKISAARELLLAGNELFYVSEQSGLPYDEVEDLYCKINGAAFDDLHRDNKKPIILY